MAQSKEMISRARQLRHDMKRRFKRHIILFGEQISRFWIFKSVRTESKRQFLTGVVVNRINF